MKAKAPAKGGEFVLPNDNLPDIFTVNDLTEEHQMIRETIREFVAREITTDEAVNKIESKDFKFSRELLVKLGQLGLLGAEVPEEYGGQGLDKITGAIIAEEMSRQGSFATTFLAHTGIGTLPIRYFGTEDQKKKYLPRLVSGEWVAAYSLTEAGAGSDANASRTKAILSEDGKFYILNGEKKFITNGGFADLYIIFAKIENDEKITAFIVERTFPGVIPGKEEHKMGIQGSSTVELLLQDAMVPVENLLGERAKGYKEIALNILNLGRFKLGAACLGAGKMCLEESLKYSQERKQFGKRIIEFGAIREKLAMIVAMNYAMEAIVYRTAGYLEEAIGEVDTNDSRAVLKAIGEFVIECSLVKVFCSEALDFIVDENVQVHGGLGFCHGAPERHYRDSRINRIFEGPNEINRLLAVGMLLKKAVMGGLPLMPAIKKVIDESMTPSLQTEPEDVIDRLTYYLNNAKKVVLLAAGSAYEKFGLKLEEHQIVLTDLSNCLIKIFVMESSLAALVKNKTDSNVLMVRMIFDDGLFSLERLVREVIPMCAEGDKQRTALAMVRRLLKFTPENKEELVNGIVEGLVSKG